MSDPIVIENNIIDKVDEYLGKDDVTKEREKELSKQIRHEFEMMKSPIIMLYTNTDENSKYGLLDIKYLQKIIEFEHAALTYDEKNYDFKDNTYDGYKIGWDNLCFAGEDAEPRDKPVCHEVSIGSAVVGMINTFKAV